MIYHNGKSRGVSVAHILISKLVWMTICYQGLPLVHHYLVYSYGLESMQWRSVWILRPSTFHEMRLLLDDQPLLHFLWRNIEKEHSPHIYEKQVLPFGTKCSQCCAVDPLQWYVRDHIAGIEDVMQSILCAFYLDSCVQSFYTQKQAKEFINKLQSFLASGGNGNRKATKHTLTHLPTEAR